MPRIRRPLLTQRSGAVTATDTGGLRCGVVMRMATPADAPAIASNIVEGFESYREWAPRSWKTPVLGPADVERLQARLGDDDVWCQVALDGDEIVGHVALSLSTSEDPDPPPPGVVNLWQMFVRRAWHGRGVATELMRAAIEQAADGGFSALRLWTACGAARARRFYEREGWQPTGATHKNSPSGLTTVEYSRNTCQSSDGAPSPHQDRAADNDVLIHDPASIVERYFNVVADLAAPADALLAVLHPELRITEHPNAINPRGSIRDRDAALAAFLAGKRLLTAQTIELHEILVSGSRVAVRATWRGTIGRAIEGVPDGTELVAHIAGTLTVDDGRIREHETFDCYEPWRGEPVEPAAGP
ncbi:MAG TPA: GNAT family N-acetyltransferase [Gaiellales bacterium]|nr:GNAT family N-acetyltransferase [Gaiellales bacterium]